MRGNPPKRGFPLFLWISAGLIGTAAVVTLLVINPFSWGANPPISNQDGTLKAAIVDQLYNLEPNPLFISTVTKQLEDFGFQVDLYQGDEVTVDFYKKLPSYGYKLIILRVHGGLLQNENGIGDKIWLFTSQPYSRMSYFIAQLRDQVRAAGISSTTTPLFAISAKFVTDCFKGDFDNAVIINMACAAFYSDDMAKAFTEKGASAYLAWDVSVGLRYVDEATMTLVQKLFADELTIGDAVAVTMQENGPDPNNNAFLNYYPEENADKTLRELLK